MISKSVSFLATLSVALLSSSMAQMVYVPKGEGVCVDSSNNQYDSLATYVTSISECQTRCVSMDPTNLRGIEYEAAAQKCLCLYENGAGLPANAFSEIGDDLGVGAVAGTNATFSTFRCFRYAGGSFSYLGVGGCIDSNNEFFSFATPVNAQGVQTDAVCQSACIAAGTNGLVGLDYNDNGDCFCLYTLGSAPTVTARAVVNSNRGTGPVAGTSTFAGIECQGFEAPPTPSPTPPPTPHPIPVNVGTANDRGGTPATTTTTVRAPTAAKAPKIKSVKAPIADTSRGTKLNNKGPAPAPVAPAPVAKNSKRRRRARVV